VGGYGTQTGQGVITITCTGMIQDKTDLGDAPDSTNNYGVSMTAYPKGGPFGTQARYPTVFNDGSGTGPYGPVHLNIGNNPNAMLTQSQEWERVYGSITCGMGDFSLLGQLMPGIDPGILNKSTVH